MAVKISDGTASAASALRGRRRRRAVPAGVPPHDLQIVMAPPLSETTALNHKEQIMIVGKVFIINCTLQELPVRINRGNPVVLTPGHLRLNDHYRGDKLAATPAIDLRGESPEREPARKELAVKHEPKKALSRLDESLEIVCPFITEGPGWLGVSRAPEARQDQFGPTNTLEVMVPGETATYESILIPFSNWPLIVDLQLFVYYSAAILSADGLVVWSSASA